MLGISSVVGRRIRQLGARTAAHGVFHQPARPFHALLVAGLAAWGALAGCGNETPPNHGWQGLCFDRDGDGYGVGCATGDDCDDADAERHDGCPRCTRPFEGCACEPGAAPIFCASGQPQGESLLCHHGTRYCRDGIWSACESIQTLEVPPPQGRSIESHIAALLSPDAGADPVSECARTIFQVDDPLDVVEDGLGPDNSEQVTWAPGGGVTIERDPPPEENDAYCHGDLDCDGIRDAEDPEPETSEHSVVDGRVSMTLAPGISGRTTTDIAFEINSADVYFLIDQSYSMEEEVDQLLDDLTRTGTGDDFEVVQDCADVDGDGSPDNYLKAQGVAGNIKCLIRDAWIGGGWFREMPFSHAYSSSPWDYQAGDRGLPMGGSWYRGTYYGDFNEFVYEHVQDVAPDPALFESRLSQFWVNGNGNPPEAGAMALYAIASGQQLYMGHNRSAVPPRLDCPAGHFGWPCFRARSVPVVVMITDQTQLAGPDYMGNGLIHDGQYTRYDKFSPLNYPDEMLSIDTGSDAQYHPALHNPNDDFDSAWPAGANDVAAPGQSAGAGIDSVYKTYTGDTRELSASVPASLFQCLSDGEGHDAVYAFTVDTQRRLRLSSQGTRFTSGLAVFRRDGTHVRPETQGGFDLNALSPPNPNGNVPYHLGELPLRPAITITGNSGQADGLAGATPAQQYPRESFGVGCFRRNSHSGSQPNDGSDKTSDVAFSFTLPEDMHLSFRAEGSDFQAAMALYAGSVLVPEDVDLAAAPIGNGNDSPGDWSGVGDMVGRSVRFVNGRLQPGMQVDYPSASFAGLSDGSCDGVRGDSEDMVFPFSLSETRTLHFETSGSHNKLSPDFRSLVAIVPVGGSAPDETRSVLGNDTAAAAAQIVDSDVTGRWLRMEGTLNGHSDALDESSLSGWNASCGSDGQADAFHRLELSEPRRLRMRARAASFDAHLAIFPEGFGSGAAQQQVQADNRESTQHLSDDIRGSDVLVTGGDTRHNHNDYDRRDMGCVIRNNYYDAAPDVVYSFDVGPGGAEVAIEANADFDVVLGLFDRASIRRRDRLACDDGYGNGASIQRTLSPGTYYVVVTGYWTGAAGQYELNVRDVHAAAQPPVHACEGNEQFVEVELPAGVHFIAVKGSAGSDAGYELDIVDAQAEEPVACGSDNAGGSDVQLRRSVVEQTLPPGDYLAVVKSVDQNLTQVGEYVFSMRDTGVAPTALACHNETNGNSRSFAHDLPALDGDGNPITYTLLMRGNDNDRGGGDGDYTIVIGDEGQTGSPSLACSDANSRGYAVIERDFEPGQYFAVVKGTEADELGWYQLTLGDPSLEGRGQFENPNWSGSDGKPSIRQTLVEAGVRVITVRAGDIPGAEEQLSHLSWQTGATAGTHPLHYRVDSNGRGLGSAIIRGIQGLAGDLSVDVTLRLDGAPVDDRGEPLFDFSFRPIDESLGNGCAGVSGEKHLDCRPGATPRFSVTFTNPIDDPAPENPETSDGGYPMTLTMSATGTVVVGGVATERSFDVASVDVYIIPQGDPVALYPEQGQYWQDFGSPGCVDTETPDWNPLSIDADVPWETSLTMQVCAADSRDQLPAQCDYRTAATLVPDPSCVDPADCACSTNDDCDGYCLGGLCVRVTGSPCNEDYQCGEGATCVAERCRFDGTGTGRPTVDLKAALVPQVPGPLPGVNGKPWLRVRAVMESSEDRERAPTLYDWSVLYTCSPGV